MVTLLSLLSILLVALALRLYLLAGPQTELEGDEAIVGLMARHILQGERPVFYYMQPYMGSLEAYLAAAIFAVAGSSTFALKLVPLAAALVFTALVFATGYRVGGLAAAILSGLYVAVPPAFLALWSLKARGGYVEILALGQLMILLTLRIGKRRSVLLWEASLLGFLAGLGLWTNPLIGVYLVPIAVYLALILRLRTLGLWLLPAALGCLLGAYPLLEYNLSHGFATAGAMFGGSWSLVEAPLYLRQFARVSLPILAGLAPASSSQQFFWPAFWASPGGHLPATLLVVALSFLVLLLGMRKLPDLLRGGPNAADGQNLLVLLLVVVPAIFVVSKFRELVTEPRYLLPLYAATPVLAMSLLQARRWGRWIPSLVMAAMISVNLYSIASLDPVLNLPDTAVGSRAANRAELTEFLLSRGLDRVYTDYWIAYPLAFESKERILPSILSGGFNRYIPYAYAVSVSPNPAFVFIEGSEEERAFLERLGERGVKAREDRVSIYSVYWQATPLDLARP